MNEGVRVKVCGLTRREDVEAAVESGVDLLGLNFYSPSPRSIRPEQAADLVADLPPSVEVVAFNEGDGTERRMVLLCRWRIRSPAQIPANTQGH